MTAGEVRLEVPARTEYLYLVRSVVAATASVDARIPPARIADLRVAVSEAATNAIEAHHVAGTADRIVVRCRLDDERLEVEVRDHGEGFDEGELASLPSPEEPERLLHESGLGVPLMRTLADEAEIRSGRSGTSVRLVLYVVDPRRRAD